MIKKYPYLNDRAFLKNFDELKIKEQFIKINVLSFNDERPITEISGEVLDGSISVDGGSAMRRTANLSLIIREDKYSDVDIKRILGINKKIEILIGFTNHTKKYKDYPILWFPQGIFVIISSTITNSTQGVTISLVLHDKMALLNGQCGGTFPASVVLHEVEDVDENGEIQIKNLTIYQIIQELVNHFGCQQLGKIIISDIENKIKKVMRWIGSTPLYLYQEMTEDGVYYNSFSTNRHELEERQQIGDGTITQFTYGQDIGYILTDFIYPGELIANAGETIVSILDKIKNILGNYEYFYDIDGNFRFQEIKNYLNTSYSTFLINEINVNNYLVDYSNGKSVYVFEDANIIQSYSNSPQYLQIKNDFVVWGKRTAIDGRQIPIRYHLAIDTKPEIGNTYKVFFYIDPDDDVKKAKKPLEFSSISKFPKNGDIGQYYYDISSDIIYKWVADTKKYQQTDYILQTITTTDYRTELYLAGVANEPFGLESNYYYTELKNEWPKIYDVQNQQFFEQTIRQPSNIDFFLDFINTSAAISDFSIQNIGRRTITVNEDSINCIFEPDNPDIVIIEAGTSETDQLQRQCEKRKQQYAQVTSELYQMIAGGGVLRSAYEEIKKELYQYTDYNEQISLNILPIYYLEPNIRITIKDKQSAINGDYLIKSFSLPLNINSTMPVTCVKVLERI